MRGLLLGIIFFSILPFVFIRSAYIGILMWFWVSLMNPQKIVWSSIFASLNYAYIIAIATLLCWVFSREEPRWPPYNRTTILLVALMGWTSITSIFGLGRSEEIFLWWSTTEKMLLMTLIAFAWTNTRARLDQLIVVCVLSVLFFGVRGGIGTLMTAGAFRVFGPDGSMIGDNNDLGVAMTAMLPLLFYMLHRYRMFRLPILLIFALSLIGDLFTYSRGALLALGAMSSIALIRSRQKVLMAFVIVIAVFGVWNYAPPEWFSRMSTIEHYDKDESAEGRLYMWQLSWAMALKHPIVGAGFHWSYDHFRVNAELPNTGLPPLARARAAHSIWFQMLSDHGFPGLFLFIAILGSALLDARWLMRMARGRPQLLWADQLGRMMQASLIGFAVGGTFASLAIFDGFYVLVIITAAARHIIAREMAAGVAPVPTRARPLSTMASERPMPALSLSSVNGYASGRS